MAVKVVRRPELTFWEKIYIPQILCGLKITFSHFFRNLFLHKRDPTGNLIAPGWQQRELPSDSATAESDPTLAYGHGSKPTRLPSMRARPTKP